MQAIINSNIIYNSNIDFDLYNSNNKKIDFIINTYLVGRNALTLDKPDIYATICNLHDLYFIIKHIELSDYNKKIIKQNHTIPKKIIDKYINLIYAL